MMLRHHSTRVMTFALAGALLFAMLSLAACASPAAAPSTPAAPAAPTSPGATSADGVQRFTVDLSTGAYVPDLIEAKAGVPIEITFGQGRGCLQALVFPSFGIDADMTQGPQTFKLGALEPGDYPWACGMDMAHGMLRVK